jgi:hypothetical protein
MIMKFEKRAGRLKWYAKLEKMSQIRAWTQVPNDRHFYACGDFETAYAQDNLNTAEHTAAAFRMRNDGEMMWYATFSGVNAGPATKKKMDRCFGIAYDPTPGSTGLSVLIQGKMTNLREDTFKKGDFYDTLLISLDINGKAKKSVTISFADTLYDTYLANNGLLLAGKGDELDHFWAGWSYGFSTRRNSLVKKTPDFDAFTFKFNFDNKGYNCLWSQEYDASAVRGIMSIKFQSEIASNGIYSLFDDDTRVRKSR